MKAILGAAMMTVTAAAAFAQAVVTATDPTCGAIGQLPCPTNVNGWSADVANALSVVLMAAAAAIAGTITRAGFALWKKWGFDATAQDKVNAESDIRTVLNAGITQVLPVIEQHGWNSKEAREAILTAASNYMRQRFPDRAAAIIAKGSTVGPETAINQTLAARLPDAVATAAASPATPPLPVEPIKAVSPIPPITPTV